MRYLKAKKYCSKLFTYNKTRNNVQFHIDISKHISYIKAFRKVFIINANKQALNVIYKINALKIIV